MSTRSVVNRERGTGLIEVMVTVFVVAIGLLGMAALQTQSKRSNLEAIQRTTATMLVHEVIERMRANAGALGTYLTEGASIGGQSISAEPTPKCLGTQLCTPTEIAQHDVWEWEQAIDGASEKAGSSLTGGLIAPTGCLTGPVGGGTGVYTVAVAWRSQTELSNPAADDCGESSGKYDGPNGSNPDKFRRVLVLDVFINAG